MKKKIDLKKEWKEFKEVILNIKFRNIFPFLILPIISLITILLPANIQEILRFHLKNPQIWQFLTSAYVHQGFNHFMSNMGLYIFASIIIIYLASKTEFCHKISKLLFATLILLPIFDNVINKYVFPNYFNHINTFCGASGIVSAVIGFLPLLWIVSLKQKVKHPYNLMNIFLIYVGLLIMIKYASSIKPILIVLFGLIVFLFISRTDLFNLFKAKFVKKDYLFVKSFFPTLALMTFLLIPSAIFPSILLSNGNVTNIFGHYIGMVFGVMSSFLYFRKEIKEKN